MRSSVVASLICLLLPLACFAADEGYLRFSPQAGDERQYHTYVHSSVHTDDAERSSGQARMLMRYRVLDDAPHMRLHLQPTYMHLTERGRVGLSSLEFAGGGGGGHLRDLMGGGFIVTMDARTGDVRDFEAGDEDAWRRVASSDSHARELLEELRGVLVRPSQWPAMSARIPLREGAELTMEGGQETPDLRLKVDRVTADRVRLSIDGEAGDTRMTGFVVLERDGGWVERMAVIVEVPLEEAGRQAVLRERVAMVSDGWQGTLPFVDSLGFGDGEFRPLMTPPDEERTLFMQPGRDEVFPSGVGAFGFERKGAASRLDSEEGLITLQLGHRVRGEMEFGRLTLSDIELLDDEGMAIDLPVHADRLVHLRWWDQAHVSSSGLLLPLGWGVEDELARITEIRATASYRPTTVREVEVPLDREGMVRVEDGDSWMTVTPLQYGEGAFEFRFGRSLDRAIAWSFPPELGARGRLLSVADDAAEWLDPTDVLFLSRIRADGWGSRLQVQLEQVPERLVFHTYEIAAMPTMRETVRFVDAEQRYADPALPPLEQLWLYPPDEMTSPDGDGMPTAVAIHELEPEEAHNSLTLGFTDAQAAICTLSVENDAREQGTPLRWQPVVEGGSETWFLRRHQLPVLQRWELRTEDEVRNHFHGLEVETRLQCPGEGRWRVADYVPGERPWQIDLRALLGERPDPRMPVRTLLGRYRFLDEVGNPLALQSPGPGDDALSPVDAVLGDYLLDGRYLRIAGIPSRIESLEVTGEPVDRRWTTRFAPLP